MSEHRPGSTEDPMNRTDFLSHLRTLGACGEALDWIEQTPGEPADLWAACPRGDWMIWLLDALEYDAGTLRHIACDIAESTLHIYEQAYPDDPRPRRCIATARKYADGEATDGDLLAACDAAKEAARAAYYAEADSAAMVATWVAAWGTVKAANWDEACWDAACWCAALSPTYDAAMTLFANIVRARVPWADMERALKELIAEEGADDA